MENFSGKTQPGLNKYSGKQSLEFWIKYGFFKGIWLKDFSDSLNKLLLLVKLDLIIHPFILRMELLN